MMRLAVYFVAADGTGLIKIGSSADVPLRLLSLQTSSPVPLRLVATIPECRAGLEGELHERFAHLHSHGEWYRAEPELMEYIARHAIAPA